MVAVFGSPGNFWSWAVLVRFSLGLFVVLGLDFQALVAAHYQCEMHHHFPELGLCECDWKADQLATDNYLNWASTHLPEALVKREFSDMSSMQTK